MGLYGEELSVFHKSFIGKKISFTEEYPSTWTLTEKLGDKCDRYDEHDYEHEGSPSTGFGTFLCENVKDPNEKAIMKITMQIPYQKSELAPLAERERPIDTIPLRSQAEVDALYKLKDCKYAPTLLACKHDTQDADGPVQGGYITYLLMTKVPGDKLGTYFTFQYKTDDLFWNLEYDQRERIRQAFKIAWKACVEAGAIPKRSALNHLFWDKDTETVYLTGFPDAVLLKDGKEWSDLNWTWWNLAAFPQENDRMSGSGPEDRVDDAIITFLQIYMAGEKPTMTAVLITGATGKQGGSVIKNLVSRNAAFEILAVTRDSKSSSSQQLSRLCPSIKLVEGDMNNPPGIFENARNLTSTPIWGVFSVQAGIGNKTEEAQGKAMIDEAIQQDVKFFVYSSVDRGGDTSYDNPTDIPHFISKHNTEHHLVEKTKGTEMDWTILRPAAFFDNLVPGFMGKVFATSWDMYLKGKPLQMVATSDIGYFAAEAFLNPGRHKEKPISIAGDELTYSQMEEIFRKKTGNPVPTTYQTFVSVLVSSMKDLWQMFKWFHDQGYGADISELRRINANLKDFGTWLEKESEFMKN